ARSAPRGTRYHLRDAGIHRSAPSYDRQARTWIGSSSRGPCPLIAAPGAGRVPHPWDGSPRVKALRVNAAHRITRGCRTQPTRLSVRDEMTPRALPGPEDAASGDRSQHPPGRPHVLGDLSAQRLHRLDPAPGANPVEEGEADAPSVEVRRDVQEVRLDETCRAAPRGPDADVDDRRRRFPIPRGPGRIHAVREQEARRRG